MDDGRRHHRRRHGWRGFLLALAVSILMPFGIVALVMNFISNVAPILACFPPILLAFLCYASPWVALGRDPSGRPRAPSSSPDEPPRQAPCG